ncbi:MAG: AMP-binding protein [Candidatus Kurthia intestinigallinarum]
MFFDIQPSEKIAVQKATAAYTYEQLAEDVAQIVAMLETPKKVVVGIICRNDYKTIVHYVAALQAGHAVMLINDDLAVAMLENIVTHYEPAFLLGATMHDAYEEITEQFFKKRQQPTYSVHKDLALLLSTSGTTGSPKYVRLSYKNIQANTESIVDYLELDEHERPVINLPLSYSYGISIVNSHLQVGATLLLTSKSVKLPSFWYFVNEFKGTSIAGVPFTYQLLNRLGFLDMELPSLKTLTQAGGHLDVYLVDKFNQYAIATNRKFYVMYGQTEAAPRIAYVPYERLADKLGTIGIPVPGGRFELADTGELYYYGDNVMMGYATEARDLANGDEYDGCLPTGDLATIDEEGYATLIGRMKSFIKIKGLRINLHDVEKTVAKKFGVTVACVGNDQQLVAVIEHGDASRVKRFLCQLYNLHANYVQVESVEELPHLHTGKVDYKSMKQLYLP